MASPIKRIVQLVLDRNAAKKTEAGAKKSLGTVEKGLNRLKKAALAVGGTLAAAFVTRKIFQFGKQAVRVAAEADAIWNRLAGTINNAGGNFEELEPRIQAMARSLQDASTVGDEDFAATLQSLVNISQDVEGSLENVALAADLSAAANIDLNTASLLVGRAMVGQTSLLTRYGIVIEEGADAIEVMRDQFSGMAENEGASMEGLMKRLQNEFADFQQAIGDVIVEATGGAGIMELLIETTKNLTAWVNRNRDSLVGVAQAFGAVAKVAGLVWDGWSRLAVLGSGALSGALGVIAEGGVFVNRVLASTLEIMADLVDRIPGLGVVAEAMRERADRARAEAADLDLQAQAARDTAKALFEKATAQREANEAAREGRGPTIDPRQGRQPPSAPGGDEGDAALEEARKLEEAAAKITESVRRPSEIYLRTIQELEDHLRAGRISQETFNRAMREARADYQAAISGAESDTNRIDQALAAHQGTVRASKILAGALGDEYNRLGEEAASIESVLRVMAEEGIGPADERFAALAGRLGEVRDMMGLVGTEAEETGQVATVAGELVGAAFGAGIGPLAEGKAKQNAIMAAEQLALGLVASLNPFTAAKAAGHFTAAAKFAGIATAWKALSGAAGGGGGVGGGGGGAGGGVGGSPSAGSDLGGGRSERVEAPGPEVNLYLQGDGFDAVNPKVQRVVYTALQEAQANVGGNARVRTFRGTIPTSTTEA